ncbi:HD domain-containing protein [Dankookia sp. P2]|uniref:HD domain-containing protein n=1 Tax=Dankookia sp. P2 TaxID=3423955 RepID=UPI003D67D279
MNRPRGFQSLLDAVALPSGIRADLLRRMTAPWRDYHGLQHLTVLWARHLRFGRAGPMQRPQVARLIAAAILFHDAVLVPGAEDNEARSAELWDRTARRLRGFTAAEIAWVGGTIRATADHLNAPLPRGPGGAARLWLLDLDLSPIGEEAAVFDRNGRGLRAEARHLDDAAFARAQRTFLARIGAAPRLLRHPQLHAAFEAKARANISREIAPRPAARLTLPAADLSACGPAPRRRHRHRRPP